jgi:hypothetical protein
VNVSVVPATPVLVTVIVWGPEVVVQAPTPVGVNATVATVPAPVSEAVWLGVTPPAITVSVAFRAPVPIGVKFTSIRQALPDWSVTPVPLTMQVLLVMA